VVKESVHFSLLGEKWLAYGARKAAMVECILEAISGSGKYIIPPVSCRSVCPFGGSLSTFLTHFYCPIPFISSLVFLKKYA